MEDLRAHDDVDAAVGEGQSQRIAAHGKAHGQPAGARELERRVQADGRQVHAALLSEYSGATGDVAEARSDIEKHGAAWQVAHRLLQCVEDRAQSTEQSVGAHDIRKRARLQVRIYV